MLGMGCYFLPDDLLPAVDSDSHVARPRPLLGFQPSIPEYLGMGAAGSGAMGSSSRCSERREGQSMVELGSCTRPHDFATTKADEMAVVLPAAYGARRSGSTNSMRTSSSLRHRSASIDTPGVANLESRPLERDRSRCATLRSPCLRGEAAFASSNRKSTVAVSRSVINAALFAAERKSVFLPVTRKLTWTVVQRGNQGTFPG
jgi:hypothetical protein